MITVSFPAKILLCGEYAVLYGAPALGVALEYKKATVSVESLDTPEIILYLKDLNQYSRLIYNPISFEFDCISGDAHSPYVLLIRSICGPVFTHSAKSSTKLGALITLTSSIPQNSGLGSSASTLLALGFGLQNFLKSKNFPSNPTLNDPIILGKIQEAEHGFHSKSSGIDIQIAYTGGAVSIDHGNITPLPSWDITNGLNLWLINTGPSVSKTSECVACVIQNFNPTHPIWNAFYRRCTECVSSYRSQNFSIFSHSLHRLAPLLCQLGVVPQSVLNFIKECKTQAWGWDIKLCGAGSLLGDSCGYLTAFGYAYCRYDALETLCTRYGYTLEPFMIKMDKG